MKIILFYLGIVIFTSCNVRKADGTLTTEEGYKYYLQSSPQFRIQLYGDYSFHPLNKKYFPDVAKNFLKYTVAKIKGSKPELMYSAHTIVQPYYSSIGILYKNVKVDTSLLNIIKVHMESRLGASFNRLDTVETTCGTATRIAYQVLNQVTKIRSSHWEYLVNNNGNTLRFFFWTTNSDTSIISSEIETIVKSIRQ
jgi:hypothetical protein